MGSEAFRDILLQVFESGDLRSMLLAVSFEIPKPPDALLAITDRDSVRKIIQGKDCHCGTYKSLPWVPEQTFE